MLLLILPQAHTDLPRSIRSGSLVSPPACRDLQRSLCSGSVAAVLFPNCNNESYTLYTVEYWVSFVVSNHKLGLNPLISPLSRLIPHDSNRINPLYKELDCHKLGLS